MSHIESFDTLEEMQERLKELTQKANDVVEPWQKELTYGDHFVVYEPSWDLWAFCYVLPLSDYLNEDDEDYKAEKEMYRNSYDDGYRFCNQYSIIVPEGELGDCHVLKALMKLTPTEFELMRRIDWNVNDFYKRPEAMSDVYTLERKLIQRMQERRSEPGAIRFS